MSESPTTQELVMACRQGDQKAFLIIYDRYCRMVAARVIRMMGRRTDVEDVVQEVFTQLFRSLDRFDIDELFEPWVYRITRNVVISHRRKMSRTVDTTSVQSYEWLDARDDVWAKMNARDQLRVLYDALERFSEEEREAFLLHCVEGLTLRQVQEQTGVSENTVSTRVQRVRKKLFCVLSSERLKPTGSGDVG